jgi:hypothetical protein
MAAASLAGYVLIARWFPLAPFFDRSPLADIRTFTPSLLSGLGYAVWLCIAFALYVAAYRKVQQMERPPSLVAILLATALFGLPLLQTFPVNATDVYRYVIRGRVSSYYGQSPFSVPPDAYPTDPFLPLAGEWAGETSPYGPIWELSAGAVTRISQADLYLGLILFKVIGLFVHLLLALLTWSILAKVETNRRVARTLLWAWNPALLLMLVVDAHNDGLMLLWLLLGLWIVRLGRPTAGFLVMLLAPLTKPIGILPLPFFFLYLWRQMPTARTKARFFLLTATGGLILVTLAFLPFGSPLDLAQRLLREASSGGGFSISVLIVLVARNLGSGLSVAAMSRVATIVFGLAVVFLLWLAWRGRSPLRGAADIFLAYVLQALNFRIWYSVWPFPWVLLDVDESETASFRRRYGLWLLLTAQLSVVIYGHVRVFALGRNHFPAHIIGVPFTFALPLILAFGQKRLSSRA